MKEIFKKWRTALSVLLVALLVFGIINTNMAKADTDGTVDTESAEYTVDIPGDMETNTDQETDTDGLQENGQEFIGSISGSSIGGNTFDSNNPAAGQKINSGYTYKIVSALDSSYVWNVRDNSYYNGRNIKVYKDSGVNAQKYVFIRQKDGSYKIKSTNSSKMLESDRENNSEGANVCQYDNNNAKNQLWELVPAEDGFFYLKNKSNGLVAGITGGKAVNGADIKMYGHSGDDSQKFKLVSTDPFANATYKVVSALDSSYVWHIKYGSLSDGATVHLYKDDNYINTPKFVFTKQKDGYYVIENTNSGKTVECKGAGKKNGTDVCQNKRNNNTSQQWRLTPTEDGYYYLQNRCNGLVAEVAGGKAGNNVNIQMNSPNKSARQKFQIMVTFPLANGTYVLESGLNSSYVWDITGASKNNKANLQLYEYTGNNAQKFVVKKHYGEWDYYTIKNVNSGKIVEYAGKKEKNNTNIWQYTEAAQTDTAQLWKPVYAGSGYCYLQNWNSGLVAGVSGGKAVNKANIQSYKLVNNNGLKFKFADPSNKKAKKTSSKYPEGLLFPIKGKISRTGPSAKTGGYYCDYVAPKNTPVYAPADGKVEFRQTYSVKYGKLASYGNNIIFTSSDKKYKVTCAHFNSFKDVKLKYTSSLGYPCGVKDGYTCKTKTLATKNVKKGDLIGYTGKTGNASNYHIHIEVIKNGKRADPAKTFTAWK